MPLKLVYVSLTHYKPLCVRKFLKEFTKILIPLFVCRTENLRIRTEERKENLVF